MFNAISDQLYLLGLIPAHQVSHTSHNPLDSIKECRRKKQGKRTDHQAGDPSVTRKTAAQYMRDHKDDFIAFLPSVGGEDTAAATDDGMMTDAGFEKYCRMVAETGEWGGEPEVSHRSFALKLLIFIFSILWSGNSASHVAIVLVISGNRNHTDDRSKHYQEHSRFQST